MRLTPFDTSTEEGRSKERYRRVAMAMASSVMAKGVVVLTTLVTVPLTVGYLGPDRYGLWMTISSTVAMLGFGDLGIGLGLMNVVSEADGKDDREAARGYVSSGFFMLLGIVMLLLAVFSILFPLVSWGRVFNVESDISVREAGPAMAVVVSCFLLNILFGVVSRVQLAYQDGYINNLWEISGNLLGLCSILLAIHVRAGLPWLALSMSGPPVIASLINGIVLFGVKKPWLRPKWGRASFTAMDKIIRLGILFFLLQIAGAIAYSSDNLIAAKILGTEAVTQYAVPMKMFSAIPMLLGMVLIPLWPAYGEAISRGDVAWVRKTLSRSAGMAFLISLSISIPLVFAGEWILHLWVGPTIKPSLFLLSGFGVWAVMSCSWGAVVMFLNGANALRIQVISGFIMVGFALGAKIFFARTIGLPGIIWSTIIAQFLFVVLPMTFYSAKLLSRMSER